jgi:CRP-like cAMP-binding protein
MQLDLVITMMRQLPLFEGVEPEALRILAFSGTKRQLQAGDVLFRKGEVSEGSFLIIEGQIAYDGRADGSLAPTRFGPGVMIGQSSLFKAAERSATAIARGRVTVLVFSQDLISKVLDVHPQSALAMRQNVQKTAQATVMALRGLDWEEDV